MASISNQDIKSVTVLKDASATAAYGARGSNGVIVIETKEGRKNQEITIEASTQLGFRNKAVEGREMLSGQQRFTLYKESVMNSFGLESEDAAWDFAKSNAFVFGSEQYTYWIDRGRPDVNSRLLNHHFS